MMKGLPVDFACAGTTVNIPHPDPVVFNTVKCIPTLSRPTSVNQFRPVALVVGRTATRLHFLHSTMFGKRNPQIEDGTAIAEYRVKYEDGKAETIPVRCGEEVVDWWFAKGAGAPAKVKVAWEGENEASKSIENGVRLYRSAWKNPRPAVKILAIDFIKVGETPASPFCIAITAE